MAISKKEKRLDFFTTDKLPTMEFTIRKSDGSGVLDLSGATAVCHLRLISATSNKFSGAEENATIVDAVNGRVDYTLPSGGIDDPGVYKGQVNVSFPAGGQHTQEFELVVKEGF